MELALVRSNYEKSENSRTKTLSVLNKKLQELKADRIKQYNNLEATHRKIDLLTTLKVELLVQGTSDLTMKALKECE